MRVVNIVANDTIEEENAVIDAISNTEFYKVMLEEFGAVGAARLLGSATLYGLTGKKTSVEARSALISLGFSEQTVYSMYRDFRRLRRVLLARRGVVMDESRGGPGANSGIIPIIARVRRLQTTV